MTVIAIATVFEMKDVVVFLVSLISSPRFVVVKEISSGNIELRAPFRRTSWRLLVLKNPS